MTSEIRTRTDVLVIGGSCAGLSAAIRAKEENKQLDVTVVDKGYIGKVGSAHYSGGNFLVFLPDVHDMDACMREFIEGSNYLTDQEWLKIFLQESQVRFRDLVAWGVPFKGPGYESYPKAKPGEQLKGLFLRNIDGQDVLCMSRTATECVKLVSRRFMPALRAKAIKSGVKLLSHVVITDLMTADQQICGAVGFERRKGDFHILEAKATVIAAGSMDFKGGGNGIAFNTGDGIAMAYRCGAEIMNVEFYMGSHLPGLKNLDTAGAPWVLKFVNRVGDAVDDPSGSKNPHRMVLFRTLEMAKHYHAGLGPICLDLNFDDLRKSPGRPGDEADRQQDIGNPEGLTLERTATDLKELEGKPELTLFHQGALGDAGIKIDKGCRSQLKGLYAAGDSAGVLLGFATAGSGLAKAAVTGDIAGKSAAEYAKTAGHVSPQPSQVEKLREVTLGSLQRKEGITPDEATLVVQKLILPYDVHIVRHEKRLQAALKEIGRIRAEVVPNLKASDPHDLVKTHEVRNMALCAEMTLRAANLRTESRLPTFYREDYPDTDNKNWLKWTVVKDENGKMITSAEPIQFQKYSYKP